MEEILTLDVPSHLFKKKTAFSYDQGSTMLKVAYATEVGDILRFHFKGFAQDDTSMKDSIKFLKERFGDHLKPEDEFHVTGVTADGNKGLVEEALNVKLQVKPEGICNLDGMLFLLKNFPLHDICYEKSPTARQHGMKAALAMRNALQPLVDKGRISKWEGFDEPGDVEDEVRFQFPFLSVHGIHSRIYADRDGMRMPLDFHPTSGKALYGLGSLVTECKSFEELNALAEKGCLGSGDTGSSGKLGNLMSACCTSSHKNDVAPGDAFTKADMAAKVIRMVANIICQPCVWPCDMYGIKHIIFTGSLACGCPAIREEIAQILEEKRRANVKGVKFDFHFLKLGGHVGALGCLFRNLGMIHDVYA